MGLKVGKTQFRVDLGKDLTLKQFKDRYADKLEGYDVETIYKKLGGKVVLKKEKKESE